MTAAHEEEWALDDGQLEQTPDPNANEANEANEAPTLTDIEKLAAEMGWKPEADWKGDKSGWTPADEYIKATFRKQQEGAKRSHEMTRQVRARDRAIEDYQLRLDRLERASNQLMSEQEARHRAEIANRFEQAKREAAKAGNDELYDELLDQQREAEALLNKKFQREPEVDYNSQAQAMLDDPVVGRFLRNNPWVVQDEEAYAYAFAIAQDYADAGHPKSVQIRAVEQALREEYPERYQRRQPDLRQQRAQPRDEQHDDDLESPPNFEAEQEQRESQPRDPATQRFVPKNEAHLYQQQQRRAPAPVQAGSRMPGSARPASPEQKAWASLPDEARRTYETQKKSGAIKMDLVTYAKLYNGEPVDVL